MNDNANPVIALTTTLTLQPNDSKRLAVLCGPVDQNIKYIERRLNVRIRNRANVFELSGDDLPVLHTKTILTELYKETENTPVLDKETIHLHLQQSSLIQNGVDDGAVLKSPKSDSALITTRRKTIKPRGRNQANYLHNILSHDISFGVGPAGTGKTYLAVACAVQALESQKVNRILLVRPAVEAGEKLGFLPGDLSQKIDPYLRPLYDALYEMLGEERVNKYIERGIIEVAPLAFMRGRTLNNAFIILDESQNTTPAQMKMFLTRIGFGSTAIITGDITQIDLPPHSKSGLVDVMHVLKKVAGIHFTIFDSSDVVRHPLVQAIVDAYSSYETKESDTKDFPQQTVDNGSLKAVEDSSETNG